MFTRIFWPSVPLNISIQPRGPKSQTQPKLLENIPDGTEVDLCDILLLPSYVRQKSQAREMEFKHRSLVQLGVLLVLVTNRTQPSLAFFFPVPPFFFFFFFFSSLPLANDSSLLPYLFVFLYQKLITRDWSMALDGGPICSGTPRTPKGHDGRSPTGVIVRITRVEL